MPHFAEQIRQLGFKERNPLMPRSLTAQSKHSKRKKSNLPRGNKENKQPVIDEFPSFAVNFKAKKEEEN